MWSARGVLHPEGHCEDAEGHSGAELDAPAARSIQVEPIALLHTRFGASGTENR
jgi:hypothetical protein